MGSDQEVWMKFGWSALAAALMVLGCQVEGAVESVGPEVAQDTRAEVLDADVADSRVGSDAPDVAVDIALDTAVDGGRDTELDALGVDVSDAFDMADEVDVVVEEPPPRPEISASELARIESAVDAAFDAPTVVDKHSLSALVIDAETGAVLYAHNPDTVKKPASNTKLLTTAAALALLGPDHHFSTVAYADGSVDGSGVLTGDLVVVSEHDFTASTFFYGSARFPMDELARRVYAAGVRQVTGTLRLHGEMLYEADRFAYYDPAAHRATSVARLRDALSDAGITVTGGTDTNAGFSPPAGSLELARYASLPLWVACSEINRPSHNEFADALLRHLGWVRRGESSYAAGAAEVLAWMASEGIDTAGMALNDGSGLSHDNRVSARQLVALFEVMDRLPVGSAWARGLAVSATYGTIAGRMTGADVAGRVYGKSGTLNGVITLSGVVYHRYDGRRYVFSFMMNDVSSTRSEARAAIDVAVTALGEDHNLGARPESPTLGCVRDAGDGQRVAVDWSAAAGAEGYWLWMSPDGRVWSRDEAVYTTSLSMTVPALDAVFVRVSAVSASGESDVSDTYGARPGGALRVLVVDGNDRWEREPSPENTLASSHDFAVELGVALSVGMDTCANEAVPDLAGYDGVVWSVGEDSVDDESLSSAEQVLLADYLGNGGGVLVSGAELGYDLVSQGNAGDTSFFTQNLGAGYVSDDAGTYAVTGAGIFADLSLAGFYTPGGMVVSYPDVLSVAGTGSAVLRYVGGAGGVAALATPSGSGRAVVVGFPLETLDTLSARETLLNAWLTYVR